MHTRKQAYYFDLIDQWQHSTMVKKDFCSLHNIKLGTFQYWITKYWKTSHSPATGFVALTPSPDTQAEITYPNGVRIRVNASDPGSIAQLIHLW
jgi:hypothetical protein